jgi:NTE family protein
MKNKKTFEERSVEERSVALVLSGGSARGLAHIGVIEELEEKGYSVSSIAGTSMGAVIGAMHSLGKLQEFKEWVLELNKTTIIRLLDPSLNASGLLKGKKVFKKLEKFIPDINIEDLKIPLAIVTTNLSTKKEVVFRKGNLRKALRATISVPTIFTPAIINNEIYVDGGASNNTPVNRVKRTKGDILIAVEANAPIKLSKNFSCKKEKKHEETMYSNLVKSIENLYPKHFSKTNTKTASKFEILSTTLNHMIYNTSKQAIKETKIDYYIPISLEIASLFDFLKAKKIIEYGRYQTKKIVKEK